MRRRNADVSAAVLFAALVSAAGVLPGCTTNPDAAEADRIRAAQAQREAQREAQANARSGTGSAEANKPEGVDPAWVEELSFGLEQALAGMELDSTDEPAPARETQTTPRRPREQPVSVLATPEERGQADERSRTRSSQPADPPLPIDERIARATAELGDLLRERAMTRPDPLEDYLRLALLSGVHASATGTPAEFESELRTMLIGVEPAHASILAETVRGWMAAGLEGPRAEGVLRVLEQAETRLTTADAGLRISKLALATRVAGFGKIDAIPEQRLLAGRSQQVIVYTEIAGFGHREVTERDAREARDRGDRYAVDVTQELLLYHAGPDELLAWHRPRARVVDTSGNRRRDFYIVHQIELPSSLTVGSYTLKVRLRDETTGVETEATLPIRLVADASLLGTGRRR